MGFFVVVVVVVLPLVQPRKAKAGLVVLNSLDFCLSEKPLISPSNLNESLTG